MSEALKPCPFCGSSAHIERVGDRRQSTIYQCDNCSCSLETGEEWGHGRDWNRRADSAEITRLQKELETALEALRMISVEAKEPNEPIGRSVFKALATCGEIADLALKDKEVAG